MQSLDETVLSMPTSWMVNDDAVLRHLSHDFFTKNEMTAPSREPTDFLSLFFKFLTLITVYKANG